MMPSTSDAVHLDVRASLPVEDGVAGRGAVGAVGGQAGVVELIQGLLDDADVGTGHHRRLEHEHPGLGRWYRARLGQVGVGCQKSV